MSKAEDIKAARINQLMNDMDWKFIYFKGGNLMSGPGTRGFIPFNSRKFGALVQKQKPGTSENMINDFAKTIQTLSPDWSHLDHLICFGDKIWDMKKLEFVDDELEWVYSTSTKPVRDTKKAMKFLMELAQGNEALAHDYLQGMAPLVMYRKPAGVIWFVGDGSNGKSSLIDAIYRVFGDSHLSSLTTSAIEDGKATPTLTGILGNIVREASEARVEDTASYKAIGTHEPFSVRRLYTQDTIKIETNFHTIFNANNIPVFSDKTKGARRRTLVVPFNAHFPDNPTFEDETFTPEFLGGLLTLILEEAKVIRDNNNRYKWSDATLRAKEAYDSEVNSAEAFINSILDLGVAGFINYRELKWRYEHWCDENGLVALGKMTLKRTVEQITDAKSKIVRNGDDVARHYFFREAFDSGEDLVWLPNGYGMRDKSKPKEVEQVAAQDPPRLSKDW